MSATFGRKPTDNEILAAARTIVQLDNKPLEIFDMLGITYDLYRLRRRSGQESKGATSTV
jgi:hypothetical protein